MENKKILVTGGTGYIGSHTVVELLLAGFEVISVDNLSASFEDVNDRIEMITGKKPIFIKADLCDFNATKEIFEKHKNIQGIIHFAAYKSVNESVSEPLKYYHNNLYSVINLLKLAEEYKIYNFVFSSSCTVYGQPDILPVSENAKLKKPSSPYGNTKKIAEEILIDFSFCKPNFKIISLRYFNPIGAHSSGLIGELPIGIPNNLLPYVTQTAYGVRNELSVFGGDYDTHDGTAIRDFIHVSDLADAHLKAIDRVLSNGLKQNYEIFNLGTGMGYSVLDVVKTFKEVNNISVNYTITDRREGDIEKIWADPTYANNELKWKASRGLSEMLKDAWRWEVYYQKSLKNGN